MFGRGYCADKMLTAQASDTSSAAAAAATANANAGASNRKRSSRVRLCPDDSCRPNAQHRRRQQEHYNKLVYQARKALHQNAKRCKTFQLQKMIRAMKKEAPQDQLNTEYHALKNVTLDVVVDECVRRLGLDKLSPDLFSASSESKLSATDDGGDVAPSASSASPAVATGTHDNTVEIERILRHKQMQQAMEKWTLQVAKYRQWCNNRRYHELGGGESVPTMDGASFCQGSCTFVQLGGGGGGGGSGNGGGEAAAAAVEDIFYQKVTKKKKNRIGQRARQKAREAAVAAPQQRRFGHDGTSFRPANPGKRAALITAKVPPLPSKAMQAPSTMENNEVLHPSWQARKLQTDGIVAFQGTKITF